MIRFKKAFLRLAPVLVLGLVVPACRHEEEKTPAPQAAARAPRAVQTAAVEKVGGGTVSVPATVAARQSATLAARIPAAIRELPRREGEAVAAGAVVVRLDDSALRAGLAAAEANVRAAEADLARMQSLAKSGAATPRELEEASARAAAAQAGLSAVRENLTYSVLRSPFPGVIAARHVQVGDVVSPGQPLVEIEGAGGLELRATLSAEESGGLKPGATIPVRVDGLAAPLTARVSALSPAGDPATHRFELRADLPRAEGLRSGLFARLELATPTRAEETLAVPAAAVFRRGGLTGVFVVVPEGGGKVARLRWIAPGAPLGDRIEVRAGLTAGEQVVLSPADLNDGEGVR